MASPNCDCKAQGNEGEGELKGFDSKAIHVGQDPDKWYSKCVVPPIVLSSTHKFDQMGLRNSSGFLYSRCENPTRTALEECLASLEDAKYALTFASGVGAISTMMYLLKTGDRVLLMDQIYSGTFTFFTKYAPHFGIHSTLLDLTDLSKVEAHAESTKVDMVWIESPTNPILKVVDIEEVCKIVRKSNPNAIIVVDNTFASSYAQRPLDLGADISMQSLTKYLNGHSDVIMGGVILNNEQLYKKLKGVQMDIGSVPSPFDCYLVNRGIKTLSIRMEKHSKNAMTLALALTSNPRVEKVVYPGLESFPQHEFFKRKFKCFGGMMAVYLKADMDQTVKFLQSLKVFTFAVSLGGFDSLVEHPAFMSHYKLSPQEREAMGITENLVRVSVGLEDPIDLIDDFEQALKKAIPDL